MKQFYNKYSIRIITAILAMVLIVMYVWLTIFTQNAHLINPIFTRPLVEKIEIRNFIGRIELTTSDTEGFRLEYTNRKETDPAGYYPLFKMGTPTIATIDGRFTPIKTCHSQAENTNNLADGMAFDTIVEEDGKSYAADSYPILKITAKNNVILDVRRSTIFGFASDIAAVKFLYVKCSDFTIAKIADTAEFDVNGNVSIIIGDIEGDFSLKSTGKNTINLQNISGNAIADMDGQTNLSVAEITGNLVTSSVGNNTIEIDNVLGNTTEN